jgi:hypothetical protein
LICVEQGRLETEAILLVESLRAWGGACADAPVYAFAPRAGEEPGPETIERLESMATTMVTESLVNRFGDNPTYNKVTVSAWAERELDHDTLVFTDTDSIFLGDPVKLAEGDWDAAMRPVDRRIAGSRGKGKNEPYWRRMYEAIGVESSPFVETAVGQQPIRAYWNSGLLAARRSAGLFQAWEDALIHLHDADLVFEKWPHFMDQLSWAAVTADHHDRVRILPPSYNYPLRHRGSVEPEAKTFDLDDLVHLHYRLWFHMPESLPQVHPPFDPNGERYRWLDKRLPLLPIVDEPY